jgi:hypothetical protein
MADYLSINIPQILESATEYNDVADDIRRVQSNVDNMPDPTSAFGDDVYGHKAIPNVLAAKEASDQLLSGVHGLINGAGENLVVTGQSFDNANNVNEGIVKSFSVNP